MEPNIAIISVNGRGSNLAMAAQSKHQANLLCFSDLHSCSILNYLGFLCTHARVCVSRLLGITYNLLPVNVLYILI